MTRYHVVSSASLESNTTVSPESVLIELKKTFSFRGREIKVYSPYRKNKDLTALDRGREVLYSSKEEVKEPIVQGSNVLKSLEVF